MTTSTTRRGFLQTAGAAAALSGVHHAAGGTASRSDTVRLGIIGCGGIMTHHVKGLVGRREAVSIAWLCDVDPAQIDKMAKIVEGFQSAAPKRAGKFEDVIKDKDVDACIIATPHHWHAPIAILAMMEGKDAYIEKPISHTYDEGPLIIAAAKKYRRVIQQGSQMRSSPVTEQAGKLLKDGAIGEVKVSRAWTAEPRSLTKPVADGPIPPGVDYERWLGPAPLRPFNSQRFHGTWRMFRDYGNGEIGDDGIHDIDMAVWGLGVDGPPKEITARGGRMSLREQFGDYPDNLNVTYEYPDGRLLIYENYPFAGYGLHGFDDGNVFYGTEGYMIFSRRGAFKTFLGNKSKPGPTESADVRGNTGYPEHMANFLDAVRNRKPTRAAPEIAHLGCGLVHLGDIAYRVRGRLQFDPKAERFVDCDEANALLRKTYRSPHVLPDFA